MQQPRHRRRRRRFNVLRRVAFIVLLLLVLLPPLPWLAVALFVDIDSVRVRVEAAALRVTGRPLTFGKVTMLRSLPPTIAAEQVAFGNSPGGSRSDMVRIPYVEATFGIVPLLFGRLEILSLLLSRPDLVLEVEPTGEGNWQFVRQPTDPLLGSAHPSPRARWARRHAAEERSGVTLETLHVREGKVAWRDEAENWVTVDLRRLDATAPGMEDRAVLTAQVADAGHTVNVILNTGPLARLRDVAATVPWPVRLEVETPGAHLGVSGTLSRPLELRGYALSVEGAAENLADLQGVLHARLPPLRRLVFRTRIADSGATLPTISGVNLRVRQSDLNDWVPGLRVTDLEVAAENFDSPVRARLEGVFDRHPLRLTASLGAPAALIWPGRRPGRLPLDVSAEAAGGWLTIKGAIAAPERGSGLALDIAGAMPDLSALSPLVGQSLPSLRNITLGLHADDGEGGFRQAVSLRSIALTSSEADLGGEVNLRFAGRTAIQADLNGRSLDIDALRAALVEPQAPAPRAPAPPPAASAWLIPSDRLPLGLLSRIDLDLRASMAEMRLGGTPLREASLVVKLRDGRLSVDPFVAGLPDGAVEVRGSLDTHGRLPPVQLSVRAAGVPAQPVFAALGLPDEVTGALNLTADLSSAGASLRELAAGLGGQFGLAMIGVELDNRLVERAFGPALRAVDVPLPGAAAGRTPARCLALRLDAKGGLAALHDMVLDTPSLLVQGEGILQLRDERLALRLTSTRSGSGPPATAVRIGGVFTRTTIYAEQGGPPAGPRSAAAAQPCADAQAIVRTARAGPGGL